MAHTFKKSALSLSIMTIGLMVPVVTNAASLGSTDINFTGYVKADALVSNYSEGTLGSGSIGREFYIPSLTPVSGNDEGTQFDSHIRQSRFRFTSNTETPEGDTVTGVLELDFLVTDGGNERISNSYTPRIRHAFIKYKNWLVGQTWTTFMDVGSLPESLDFIGTTDGITFGRQVMVRYSQGGFQFALENPETTVTPFGGGGRIVADDNAVPDVIANYTWKQDWGYVKVAGIVRQLSYDDGGDIDDSETSYGVQLSGKFMMNNNDDIRWTFNTGAGLGRYSALNASNGAVITANNELEAIDSMGYSIAYRHLWNEKMRSSIMFSALDIDNDTSLTGTSATQSTYSTRVNLLYSPTKSLTVGAEYAYAKRETEGGLEGDMNRIQVSAKYAF